MLQKRRTKTLSAPREQSRTSSTRDQAQYSPIVVVASVPGLIIYRDADIQTISPKRVTGSVRMGQDGLQQEGSEMRAARGPQESSDHLEDIADVRYGYRCVVDCCFVSEQ